MRWAVYEWIGYRDYNRESKGLRDKTVFEKWFSLCWISESYLILNLILLIGIVVFLNSYNHLAIRYPPTITCTS